MWIKATAVVVLTLGLMPGAVVVPPTSATVTGVTYAQAGGNTTTQTSATIPANSLDNARYGWTNGGGGVLYGEQALTAPWQKFMLGLPIAYTGTGTQNWRLQIMTEIGNTVAYSYPTMTSRAYRAKWWCGTTATATVNSTPTLETTGVTSPGHPNTGTRWSISGGDWKVGPTLASCTYLQKVEVSLQWRSSPGTSGTITAEIFSWTPATWRLHYETREGVPSTFGDLPLDSPTAPDMLIRDVPGCEWNPDGGDPWDLGTWIQDMADESDAFVKCLFIPTGWDRFGDLSDATGRDAWLGSWTAVAGLAPGYQSCGNVMVPIWTGGGVANVGVSTCPLADVLDPWHAVIAAGLALAMLTGAALYLRRRLLGSTGG